jgi:hypothetical protein
MCAARTSAALLWQNERIIPMASRAWCAAVILSGPIGRSRVMPSRRAVSLAGMRGAFSLSLNPRPVAANARECAVRHCTLSGNRRRASCAVARLKAMYRPRLRTACPIMIRVDVLPVPAPAISASSAPAANASRAANCSPVASTVSRAPPVAVRFTYTLISDSARDLTHSFVHLF